MLQIKYFMIIIVKTRKTISSKDLVLNVLKFQQIEEY